MSKGLWKTKEGKIIEITDMSDNHLFNSIEMLKKNLEGLGYTSRSKDQIGFCRSVRKQIRKDYDLIAPSDDEWDEFYFPMPLNNAERTLDKLKELVREYHRRVKDRV